MMKKVFLLSALSALVAGNVSAQTAANKSILAQPRNENKAAVSITGLASEPIKPEPKPAGKPTAGGTRWYSYFDFLRASDITIDDSLNLPYSIGTGNAKGIYGDGSGGTVADTIQLASFGVTVDPAFSRNSGFNEAAIFGKSEIGITRADAYRVDSVKVFAVYGRDNTKTASVDTLRISVVYGNGGSGSDLAGIYYRDATYMAKYGVDTIFVNALMWDNASHSARGTTKITKDIYLKNTDTNFNLAKPFMVPVGLNVPAGNVVGVTATFLSGQAFTPYVDTAFYGSLRTANPFGMGLLRPAIFADPTGVIKGYPKYNKGYYNFGFLKFLPNTGPDSNYYTATTAYISPDWPLEIPNIDVKISCTSCKTIQELGITEPKSITGVTAFPNPSNDQISVQFTAKENAAVTVSIANVMGQVIATQNLGNTYAGQTNSATFNTGGLASGIYLYTIEANGQRMTNRFSVVH